MVSEAVPGADWSTVLSAVGLLLRKHNLGYHYGKGKHFSSLKLIFGMTLGSDFILNVLIRKQIVFCTIPNFF